MKPKKEIQTTQEAQVMPLELRQQRDLALYSPTNCYKHSNKLRSIRDVLNLPSKTLADFRREYGREWTIGYISMWLIELNDNANVKQKMTDIQMEMTAERILDTYSLKITDLTLFFRNVKDGVYGSFYENLSREKIMEWIAIYFDERCDYAAMQSQSQHDGFSMTKDSINPKVIKEMFRNVGVERANPIVEKNGIGSRMKKELNKNRDEFLLAMMKELRQASTEELKKYLVSVDKDSDIFDPDVYELVEKEIDNRK